jgi:hypothetical protein
MPTTAVPPTIPGDILVTSALANRIKVEDAMDMGNEGTLFVLQGANATTANTEGGSLSVLSGTGTGTAYGGDIDIQTGAGGTTGESGSLTISTANSATGGGRVDIITGSATSATGNGGQFEIELGDGRGGGGFAMQTGNGTVFDGGSFEIACGDGVDDGGSFEFVCGDGGDRGGSCEILCGDGGTGNGGDVFIESGTSTSASGGFIRLTPGTGPSGTGRIDFRGPLTITKSAVTQLTDIGTGVIANGGAGVITTVANPGILTTDCDSFTVTNDQILSTDSVMLSIIGWAGTIDGTTGIPSVVVTDIATGSFKIVVCNAGDSTLTGQLKILFVII